MRKWVRDPKTSTAKKELSQLAKRRRYHRKKITRENDDDDEQYYGRCFFKNLCILWAQFCCSPLKCCCFLSVMLSNCRVTYVVFFAR
ncbi:unnamed protein product [Camellia sinensis]